MIASHPKTVLITGSSTGIGRATAILAAEAGHRVFATARDPATLADLSARGNVTPIALDVLDGTSIAACAERALDLTDGAGLDVLVNNAGFSACGPLELVPPSSAR